MMETTGRLLDHYQVVSNLICENRYSIVAEIGVWNGRTSRRILESEAGQIIWEYYAIDCWLCDEQYWPGMTQEKWDRLYIDAVGLVPWFRQLRIIKLDSIKAASIFCDGYFDFVYIDADHRYDSVMADIKAWLPKVRPGGMLAGHDYLKRVRSNHQVKPAVDEFFGEDNIVKEKSAVWFKRVQG